MENDIIQSSDTKDFITYAKEAIGMINLEIFLKKIDDRAVIPTYAHDGDVGMDLTAIFVEYDYEKDMYLYHTGLSFQTDKHYGILIFPRSSNRDTDAYLCNHVAVIDSAIYRGEIILCFKNRTSLGVRAEIERMRSFFREIDYNPSNKNLKEISNDSSLKFNEVINNPMRYAPYEVGKRIAQMVVIPYPNIKINEREALSSTERGTNGFGSTN